MHHETSGKNLSVCVVHGANHPHTTLSHTHTHTSLIHLCTGLGHLQLQIRLLVRARVCVCLPVFVCECRALVVMRINEFLTFAVINDSTGLGVNNEYQ